MYDSVICFTSAGSFGSMKNTTGNWRVSPAASSLLLEAEALELLEVLRRLHRRVARDRLARHRATLEVDEVVLHLDQLARMDFDMILDAA